MLDKIALETPRPEPLATNIELLTAELGLSRAAWKVIGAIACHQRFDMVRNLGETLANTVDAAGSLDLPDGGRAARHRRAAVAPGSDRWSATASSGCRTAGDCGGRSRSRSN